MLETSNKQKVFLAIFEKNVITQTKNTYLSKYFITKKETLF